VLVRVQDLRDRPAALPRAGQYGGGIERIDRQRLAAGFGGDEILVIAQLVGCPDALDQHAAQLTS
jgi:hypothetical protein